MQRMYVHKIHAKHFNGEQQRILLLNSAKRQRQKQNRTDLSLAKIVGLRP
jgi:hypothetical protein